ncbi:unnamed protein product [Rotaria sp. Silwood2]|nr:unnamed protein product [Rotaria sp. Silwood2]CAF4202324.1 unnamed protein product [Rotaria sp. Silwood2]
MVGSTRQMEQPDFESLSQLKTDVALLKAELAQVKAKAVTGCRVCFQETEGSSQCQGTRNSCSSWSMYADWTQPFRDDTDGREGGCHYQWKVECLSGI